MVHEGHSTLPRGTDFKSGDCDLLECTYNNVGMWAETNL